MSREAWGEGTGGQERAGAAWRSQVQRWGTPWPLSVRNSVAAVDLANTPSSEGGLPRGQATPVLLFPKPLHSHASLNPSLCHHQPCSHHRAASCLPPAERPTLGGLSDSKAKLQSWTFGTPITQPQWPPAPATHHRHASVLSLAALRQDGASLLQYWLWVAARECPAVTPAPAASPVPTQQARQGSGWEEEALGLPFVCLNCEGVRWCPASLNNVREAHPAGAWSLNDHPGNPQSGCGHLSRGEKGRSHTRPQRAGGMPTSEGRDSWTLLPALPSAPLSLLRAGGKLHLRRVPWPVVMAARLKSESARGDTRSSRARTSGGLELLCTRPTEPIPGPGSPGREREAGCHGAMDTSFPPAAQGTR